MVGQGEGLRALLTCCESGDPRGSAYQHLFVEPAHMDGLEHERFEAVPVRPPCAEESFGLDAYAARPSGAASRAGHRGTERSPSGMNSKQVAAVNISELGIGPPESQWRTARSGRNPNSKPSPMPRAPTRHSLAELEGVDLDLARRESGLPHPAAKRRDTRQYHSPSGNEFRMPNAGQSNAT